MDQIKFLTGIFSVYDSATARDFKGSERYPLGFEAIFTNDAVGREFATNLQTVMERLRPQNGVLFRIEGAADASARSADCFFSDADTLRHVLHEALPGIGIFHEERGVLPKFALIEEARCIMASPMLSL
jgi:hypothetical protein